MLHLLEVQLLIHVAGDALGDHDRERHGLVLLELLTVGALETLDETEAIAVLHAGTATDFSSILFGSPVAELLKAVLNSVFGGAEAAGCDHGVLAFTNEDESGSGNRAATGPLVVGTVARLHVVATTVVLGDNVRENLDPLRDALTELFN